MILLDREFYSGDFPSPSHSWVYHWSLASDWV